MSATHLNLANAFETKLYIPEPGERMSSRFVNVEEYEADILKQQTDEDKTTSNKEVIIVQ